MANLTPAQVDKLLDKLISDDSFRALLVSDPASALKQVGAPEDLCACFVNCKGIADPQTLRESRATIQQQLTSKGSMNVHSLCRS
jgi:putative modified peptide